MGVLGVGASKSGRTTALVAPLPGDGEAPPDARTDPVSEQVRRQPRRGMRSAALFGLVFAGYLAVAVVLSALALISTFLFEANR